MVWCNGVVTILLGCMLSLSTSLPLFKHPDNVMADMNLNRDEKCSLCIDAIKIIQDALDSNRTLKDVFPLIERICVDVMEKKDSSAAKYMCPGLISSYGPVVQYVLTEKVLDPQNVCQQLQLCSRESLDHTVASTVDQKPSKDHYSSKTMDTKMDTERDLKSRKPQVTFVQISDIHLDREYAEGSPVDCGLYLCCRRWYNGTGQAGHYGSHHCDLPVVTLDLLLDTLRDLQPKPDFLIYTGDNPPHDIWNETLASQLSATEDTVSYVASKLPNVSIYPAMGNHETWPQSEYLGTLPQYQYLTDELSKYWQKWVNFSKEALDSIANGGYYSVKLLKNLRLISFNSNYGYLENLFTLLNDENKHYQTQWQWMMDELASAKRNGEKVLIIAHIPPGDDDNLAAYGEIYLNMTRQFSDVIVGHLFGHTHMDQFQLIQDEDGVYGVALVSPPVTPYPAVNPSFRVFTMDNDSLMLTGYQQYYLNLTKANEMYRNGAKEKPQFELSYSTFDEYELSDLSPQSWADLVERFYQSPSLLDKYHYHVHVKSSASDRQCDQECRKSTLCSVLNIVSTNYFKCIVNSI